VSFLHEWEATAAFGLGTVYGVHADEMDGELWDIEIFFPARTNVIGAVTSKRSSRADSIPHAKTSAATSARSEALIGSPAGGVAH